MSEEGTNQQALYTAAEYREHQEGQGHREPAAHDHAGVVRDPAVSRFLAVLGNHYDPDAASVETREMPANAQDLEIVRRMRRVEGTETARAALENGDWPTLKHLTGDNARQADVSGMKAIEKLDEVVTGPAPVLVVLGEMGAGKTDFAGLCGQRWTRENPKGVVGTNIRSLREKDAYLSTYPDLIEWVEQDGPPLENDQQPKLFIGDEFSSSAGGGGRDGYETRQKMGPLVYKIRKYNGALIYIAHGEKSIHPLLWRVGKIVKKTDLKRAVVANRVQGDQLAGVEMEIEGIPQTDWTFRTGEPSSWAWERHGSSEEGEEIEPDEAARQTAIYTAIRCKQVGMSDRDTADFVPYSHGWVNSRWEEYNEDVAHRETLDTVESVIA